MIIQYNIKKSLIYSFMWFMLTDDYALTLMKTINMNT